MSVFDAVLLNYLQMKDVNSCWRYPYFDAYVGLVWSNDPESYAGGRIATGRATHARQVKDDDPDKKEYPAPPGWGWVWG